MKLCLNRWGSRFAILIAGLFFSFTAQANLIVNGGFENPIVSGDYERRNGSELSGWTVVSPYQGIVQFSTSYDPVSQGSQAIQIEQPGDFLSQSFGTVTGEGYTVSFDLSAFSVYGGPGLMTQPCSPLCSSVIGVTIGPITTMQVFTGSSSGYSTKTLQFTADSSTTTLLFKSLYEGDDFGNYPHIDNVSVIGPAPVPIPPALWLFGSGLIGLVGMARRKAA